MFLENKYCIWYHDLMVTAIGRDIQEYTENHHILPRALGGEDKLGNLVRLTFREHFIAHWLLTKFTQGSDKRGMYSALVHMCRQHSGRIVSSWQYELAKIAGHRAFMARRHTKETRELLSKINSENPTRPMQGRRHTEKSRSKISSTRLERGIGHTPQSKAKISVSLKGNTHLKGVKHTEETRLKMSVAHRGNQNAKGHRHTEEWKRQNSERMIARHAANRLAKALLNK